MALSQAGRTLHARGDLQPSCRHLRSCSHQVPGNIAVWRRGPPPAAAAPSNKSFDAEDELDKDLAEELARFKSPDAWNSMAKHLDLVWKIGRVRALPGLSKQQLTNYQHSLTPCMLCCRAARASARCATAARALDSVNANGAMAQVGHFTGSACYSALCCPWLDVVTSVSAQLFWRQKWCLCARCWPFQCGRKCIFPPTPVVAECSAAVGHQQQHQVTNLAVFVCHAGAMMVGDTLFHGPDGSSHCPVCKGKVRVWQALTCASMPTWDHLTRAHVTEACT
jgi:hypothetical protein